jgi:transcriptional regulator with XRE-family HTH domain
MDITNSDWLSAELARSGVTIAQLSSASGVSRNQISRIKAGSGPRLDTYRKIVLGLDAIKSGAAA